MATPKLDLKRVIDAGVGVTDLAVETVRDYAAEAQKNVQQRVAAAQKTVITFDPKATYTALETRVVNLPAAGLTTATDVYGDLVKRGQTLVGRIRRQSSTQEAVAAAETTVAKAKTTRTQATAAAKKSSTAAKKASAKKRTATKSSAKATRTSAKKTVSAGSRALVDAAKKVGD